MKVYLGADSKNGYEDIPNFALLGQRVLDAEALEIYCDKFLSRFSFSEVPKVLELILKKLRIGGVLRVEENDFQSISRQIFREETPIDVINNHVFPTSGVMTKCMLSFRSVKDLIPESFELTKAHFGSHTFSLEVRRIK